MKRIEFIKRASLVTLGTVVFTGIYTWQIEPFWLEFVQMKMPIRNLPKSMVGKTIMQISDIHVGNRFDYQYSIDAFKQAQKLEPDIVVYTGDFVSYEDEKQHDQLDEVLQHVVKGKTGTVGILGNHDYGQQWSQSKVADRITSQLESAGIFMLRNEYLKVDGLKIIGFDDYWSPFFEPEKAMVHYNKEEANLVLCHNPDVCDLDVWNNYQGWILSGHTHGGQCKPPFLPAPMLPVANKNYDSGEIDLQDGRILYINRALGHLWQVRFNIRPEITVFELESKA